MKDQEVNFMLPYFMHKDEKSLLGEVTCPTSELVSNEILTSIWHDVRGRCSLKTNFSLLLNNSEKQQVKVEPALFSQYPQYTNLLGKLLSEIWQ